MQIKSFLKKVSPNIVKDVRLHLVPYIYHFDKYVLYPINIHYINPSIARMAGDVNIFCQFLEKSEAEIEIMIAEQDCRRKGLGMIAVKLMMEFARKELGKTRFISKISQKNVPSIKLFEKLGYKLWKNVEVFNEVHYEYNCLDGKELFP